MKTTESKVFLRFLAFSGALWIGVALTGWGSEGPAIRAFFSAFRVVLLDLVFLILLFWQLFFGNRAGNRWKVRATLFFTFKLVCLAFLAITLKRLRNDPELPVVFALLFMGAGPLLAATLAQIWIRSTLRARP